MMIGGIEGSKCEAFWYLRYIIIIRISGGIKKDVDNRIKTGWMIWKMMSDVLFMW